MVFCSGGREWTYTSALDRCPCPPPRRRVPTARPAGAGGPRSGRTAPGWRCARTCVHENPAARLTPRHKASNTIDATS
eukprot:3851-Pyramimonas_sp.AAC.1